MRRRTALLQSTVVLAVAGLLAVPTPGAAAPPKYQHLNPGGQPSYTETVPVNVVFVGYERDQVRRDRFLAGLAERYQPVVRSRAWYGKTEKLGITYTYDVNTRYTGKAYENRFFRKLKRLSRPAPLTDFQTLYNQQQNNVRRITHNNYIDAPSVERWLAYNPPRGINTHRNTVFFVNWYGRKDFRAHVYTKMNEPDPDTGYNFGKERESRKIIAWGGTTARDEENGLGSTRRVWFHDLSAGPESWTENWNVDNPDLDGNGEVDYRMPPVWEYRRGGFRAPWRLSGDLSLITRYVAMDLLFTTSPLYPVDIESPDLPKSIELDTNTYEGIPGVDASRRYIDRALLLSELRELRKGNRFSYDPQDLPYTGRAKTCYEQQLRDVSCFPRLAYPPFANLYLYNKFNLGRTIDKRSRADYQLPIFNYAVPAGVGAPALGYADDDYRTGTQSYVFGFVSPEILEAGYGLTTTLIHEVGHHVGLSHPHDGYDSATDVHYGPSDRFFFAWAGDETNSMMSYIDLNWDFSQFDQDNSNRFLAAGYTEASNTIAAWVLADPDRNKARDELAAADRLIGRSERAFRTHAYRLAYWKALRAYQRVVEAAREVGVPIDSGSSERDVARFELPAARAGAEPPRDEGVIVDSLEEENSPRNNP